ncbi:MAG: YceI family protein [Abitibacteriaceae bacterium]|nr:YceI family protein [Abditibacteriaceae bacterium]MBV9865401.1 YceI family protein [Abditibacteriaceae bacterium]
MKQMNRRLTSKGAIYLMGLAVGVASVGAGNVQAAPQTFNFEDPKGVNVIDVTLDSLLEPSTGLAHGIAGTVRFDPKNPQALTGKITADATTLQFVNKMYTQAAQSDKGLDTKKYPKISFNILKVASVKTTAPNVFAANVTGDFALHGVTKRITVPVTATLLPGKVADRSMGMAKGDLLILRSNFKIKRGDYGIAPAMPAPLVAPDVQIHVAIAGMGTGK